MIDKKKQEPKYVSKKYKDWIESEREKIAEVISSANKSKEMLGYGDVSFVEFLRVEVNIEKDQSEVNALITAQQEAKDALEAQEYLFDEEQLLNEVLKEPSEESLKRAANRIKLLREIGDNVSADALEKKLTDTSKPHGIKPKTIKELISPKKQKKGNPDELPFHVLGYNSERKILIWHKGHLMSIPVSQLRTDELSLIVGLDFEAESLKTQIIKVAHQKGLIDEEDPIKSGVWEINKEWLVVSGRDSLLIGSDSATPLDGPVFQDRIVHFEKNGWIKTDRIAPGTCSLKETFDFCLKHVSQWEWNHPDMTDYVTAFVMLSPFQQAMNWRPWLYVIGPTSCGKSAFFEYVLEQIYGRLVKKIDKATAHSVAQAIGNTSKILILDEFEKNKHIPDILEVLKLMGRGGSKTSGTPGKSEISYALHHMPWMASIYLPRTINIDEAQRNRMIRFDLKKKRGGKSLDILSSEDTETLCANIISSIIPRWEEIQKEAASLEKESSSIIKSLDGKVSGRMVQNFMYASALLSIVKGKAYTVPEWAKQEECDDGQTIIEAIVYSKVRYEGGEHLVSDLIDVAVGEPISGVGLSDKDALWALRQNGLSVAFRGGKWFLAIHPDSIRKTTLKGDEDFKDLDISAPLERMPGAEKSVLTSWGKGDQSKRRCIHLPIESLNLFGGVE